MTNRKKSVILISWNLEFVQNEDLFKKQQGLCAVCGKSETSKTPGGFIRPLNIDHCHKTNKIRGLLCFYCNIAVGHFEDNIVSLKKAIKYLKHYEVSDNTKNTFNTAASQC